MHTAYSSLEWLWQAAKSHLKTEENRGFDLLNKSYEPSNIDMNNFNNHSMNKEVCKNYLQTIDILL